MEDFLVITARFHSFLFPLPFSSLLSFFFFFFYSSFFHIVFFFFQDKTAEDVIEGVTEDIKAFEYRRSL